VRAARRPIAREPPSIDRRASDAWRAANDTERDTHHPPGGDVSARPADAYHRREMPELRARQRRELPDSAFAYIDGSGRRRLPINDESHVRNALARFDQVVFEDETARDRARTRLLRAARRYGIVPIGFVEGQIRAGGPRSLPTGHVTFLVTDIVDSTGLLQELEEGYGPVLADVRRLVRTAVRRHGGREVDARGDEVFSAFGRAPSAVVAALEVQRAISSHAWPNDTTVQVRVGLHSGRPTLTEGGYVGLAVHTVSRICRLAGGGEILSSGTTIAAIGEELPASVTLEDRGPHRLRGVREMVTLFEIRRRG
jgi:class 3 adenylate cyclase